MMTRDSLDDLGISKYLIINYIAFLRQRAETQNFFLQKEYANLRALPLTKESNKYIYNQEYYHLRSTQEYQAFLLDIEKRVNDFFETNQRPLPLYAKELYHNNIQEHKKQILKIIDNLFKD